MWKIILADGTELTGFTQNGSNYVSKTQVDESVFEGNLSTLTLTDGETEIVMHNAELIQQQKWADGSWYLAFREKTAQQKAMERMEAQIAANADRQEFLEDCIAEMACQVYSV